MFLSLLIILIVHMNFNFYGGGGGGGEGSSMKYAFVCYVNCCYLPAVILLHVVFFCVSCRSNTTLYSMLYMVGITHCTHYISTIFLTLQHIDIYRTLLCYHCAIHYYINHSNICTVVCE